MFREFIKFEGKSQNHFYTVAKPFLIYRREDIRFSCLLSSLPPKTSNISISWFNNLEGTSVTRPKASDVGHSARSEKVRHRE